MRDANYPVRKAYYAALAGIMYDSKLVPVYYQEAPNDVKAANYIVLNDVVNTDASTKYKSAVGISISVTIRTSSDVYNSGKAADFIASEVLTRIYPNKQIRIDLSPDNMQCITSRLSGDFTQNYGQLADRKYIDRILTFRHEVFQY